MDDDSAPFPYKGSWPGSGCNEEEQDNGLRLGSRREGWHVKLGCPCLWDTSSVGCYFVLSEEEFAVVPEIQICISANRDRMRSIVSRRRTILPIFLWMIILPWVGCPSRRWIRGLLRTSPSKQPRCRQNDSPNTPGVSTTPYQQTSQHDTQRSISINHVSVLVIITPQMEESVAVRHRSLPKEGHSISSRRLQLAKSTSI